MWLSYATEKGLPRKSQGVTATFSTAANADDHSPPAANVPCVSTDNGPRAAVHLEMTLTIKGNLLQNKESD